MPKKRNVWCPSQTCDAYKAPEQLCRVCLAVFQASVQAVLIERNRCVEVLKPLSFQSCGCYQEMVRLI